MLSMRHIKGYHLLFSCVVFGLFSLLAVITRGLAKGCISEQGGAINQHTCRKPNITRTPTFIPSVGREDVNWLDRAAV